MEWKKKKKKKEEEKKSKNKYYTYHFHDDAHWHPTFMPYSGDSLQ